tara:strand:+ start:74 stop:190 length:117 start_codon:yes stop_codon:yes gene_type:complete
MVAIGFIHLQVLEILLLLFIKLQLVIFLWLLVVELVVE